MDMALAAAISSVMQAQVLAQVQTSVAKVTMDSNNAQSAKLLQTMPSVDANPNIGHNINLVA